MLNAHQIGNKTAISQAFSQFTLKTCNQLVASVDLLSGVLTDKMQTTLREMLRLANSFRVDPISQSQYVYPSMDYLVERTGFSKATINKHIKKFCGEIKHANQILNFFVCERRMRTDRQTGERRKTNNHYHINVDGIRAMLGKFGKSIYRSESSNHKALADKNKSEPTGCTTNKLRDHQTVKDIYPAGPILLSDKKNAFKLTAKYNAAQPDAKIWLNRDIWCVFKYRDRASNDPTKAIGYVQGSIGQVVFEQREAFDGNITAFLAYCERTYQANQAAAKQQQAAATVADDTSPEPHPDYPHKFNNGATTVYYRHERQMLIAKIRFYDYCMATSDDDANEQVERAIAKAKMRLAQLE